MSVILYQNNGLVIDEDVIKVINESTKQSTSYLVSKINSTNIRTKDFTESEENILGIILLIMLISLTVLVGIVTYHQLEYEWCVRLTMLSAIISMVVCLIRPPFKTLHLKRYYINITQSSGELINIYYTRHINIANEIETTLLHLLSKK